MYSGVFDSVPTFVGQPSCSLGSSLRLTFHLVVLHLDYGAIQEKTSFIMFTLQDC